MNKFTFDEIKTKICERFEKENEKGFEGAIFQNDENDYTYCLNLYSVSMMVLTGKKLVAYFKINKRNGLKLAC